MHFNILKKSFLRADVSAVLDRFSLPRPNPPQATFSKSLKTRMNKGGAKVAKTGESGCTQPTTWNRSRRKIQSTITSVTRWGWFSSAVRPKRSRDEPKPIPSPRTTCACVCA
jgi:hypothetical protein